MDAPRSAPRSSSRRSARTLPVTRRRRWSSGSTPRAASGRASRYARQWLYAVVRHGAVRSEPRRRDGRLGRAWSARPRSAISGHGCSPASFAHIAGGYAAGYYGYMWAEVLALDMLSAFGATLMNPEVGRRFRSEILARGGEETARVARRAVPRPTRGQSGVRRGNHGTATLTQALGFGLWAWELEVGSDEIKRQLRPRGSAATRAIRRFRGRPGRARPPRYSVREMPTHGRLYSTASMPSMR